jgi:uncharacterized cupin superfamily protein
MAAKQPIHEDEVAIQTWYAGTDQEIRGRALCDVGGRSRVGVGLLELPPGCNTRPAHYHTKEEEHLYVLEGRATLHLGGARHTLTRGSYVCFPTQQPLAHHISNEGPNVFKYLMIGERIEGDEVICGGDY